MGLNHTRRKFLTGVLPVIGAAPWFLNAGLFDSTPSPTTHPEGTMYLVRDVFRCKPGKSAQLADKFKTAIETFKGTAGVAEGVVMVDYVGSYWTVVMETTVEDLAAFERHMKEYREKKEMRDAMAGYMDLVEEGHREIYRIV